MRTSEILNFIQISDVVASCGQPSKAQFEAAAADGYAAVINLAPNSENKNAQSEAEILRSLGLDYHHIPVVWTNPQLSDFEQFGAAMESLRAKKLLIHCVANLRATAFYSLYAMKNLGWTDQKADALMKPLWSARPEYEDGGVWKTFVDQRRREILARL